MTLQMRKTCAVSVTGVSSDQINELVVDWLAAEGSPERPMIIEPRVDHKSSSAELILVQDMGDRGRLAVFDFDLDMRDDDQVNRGYLAYYDVTGSGVWEPVTAALEPRWMGRPSEQGNVAAATFLAAWIAQELSDEAD